MNRDDVAGLLDEYMAWMKESVELREMGDWVQITTPYLDRHNDFIQIYAASDPQGNIVMSDDGYTIADLEHSGCRIDTPKRKELLETTLRGFGVKREDGELVVHASRTSFPLKKHNLIQAILGVNDLFYLAQPTVQSVFYEDVMAWLDANGVRYTPNVKFTGQSGYDHRFDFVVPKSAKMPERFIQTINRPTRDKAESVAFSWIDTSKTRSADARAFAVINDAQTDVPAPVLEALTSYSVEPVLWGARSRAVSLLTQ